MPSAGFMRCYLLWYGAGAGITKAIMAAAASTV
jgi:hypothetical protein